MAYDGAIAALQIPRRSCNRRVVVQALHVESRITACGAILRAVVVERSLVVGFDVLLRAFMIDKALYELSYELNNRPEWVHIPLSGLLHLRSFNPA